MGFLTCSVGKTMKVTKIMEGHVRSKPNHNILRGRERGEMDVEFNILHAIIIYEREGGGGGGGGGGGRV